MGNTNPQTLYLFYDEATDDAYFLPTKPVDCPQCGNKNESAMTKMLNRLRAFNSRNNDTGCKLCGGDQFIFVVDKAKCDPILYKMYSERYPDGHSAMPD